MNDGQPMDCLWYYHVEKYAYSNDNFSSPQIEQWPKTEITSESILSLCLESQIPYCVKILKLIFHSLYFHFLELVWNQQRRKHMYAYLLGLPQYEALNWKLFNGIF